MSGGTLAAKPDAAMSEIQLGRRSTQVVNEGEVWNQVSMKLQ